MVSILGNCLTIGSDCPFVKLFIEFDSESETGPLGDECHLYDLQAGRMPGRYREMPVCLYAEHIKTLWRVIQVLFSTSYK